MATTLWTRVEVDYALGSDWRLAQANAGNLPEY